jgi:hypothetical protein
LPTREVYPLCAFFIAGSAAGCVGTRGDASIDPPSCHAIVQFSPTSATLRVGETVQVAFTYEERCPALGVRTETPQIVAMRLVTRTGMIVVALAPGDGRIRLTSGVDASISQVALFTVTP